MTTTTNPSAEASSGRQNEPESDWSESRLAKFWEGMRHLYGKRWEQEHGAEINHAWRNALLSMTPEEATLGYKACMKSGDEHPCTLPAFVYRVKCALLSNKPVAPITRRLPEPKETRKERAAKASEYLEEARQKLGQPTERNEP